MENKQENQLTEPENDFFENLATGTAADSLQPVGLWQKFWRNTRLRVAVGLVLFLSALAGVAGYFLYSWQSSSQNLTDYVPGSAWLYLEFNFDAEDWQDLQQQQPGLGRRINDFFIRQGLTQQLINLSSRIALVGSMEEGQLVWSWLLKTPEPRQLEAFLESGTFLRQPGTQVAVISRHPDTVRDFNYRPGREPVFPADRQLWHGYVNPGNLTAYFENFPETNIASRYLLRDLGGLDNNLPLSISQEDIVFKISVGQHSQTGPVWPDYTSSYDLVLRNANLANTMEKIETALEDLPLSQFYWQAFKEESVRKYAVNWHTLRSLLDQPVLLAIVGGSTWGEYSSSSEMPLRLHDYEAIINLTDLADEAAVFANDLIRQYLAFNYPQEVVRTLPDGTQATDLVVNFDQYDFSSDPEDRSVNTISVPGSDIGFLYTNDESGFTLVNSHHISNLSLADLLVTEFHCGSPDGEQLYANSGLLGIIPWLQDFNEIMITNSVHETAVCLR